MTTRPDLDSAYTDEDMGGIAGEEGPDPHQFNFKPKRMTPRECLVIYGGLTYVILCVLGVTLWLMKLAVGLLVGLL